MFFSNAFFGVKTSEVDGGKLLLKTVQYMVTLNYHVIARAGFTLRGAPGTLKIFATSSCQT